MPGIVGLITRMPRARAEAEVRRMVASIDHESFYETGTWIDEHSGVYVGWTARENSFAAGMPLVNERGDLVLVFSGEDYPSPRIDHHLEARGHLLDGRQVSYLVHLAEDDSTFPAVLNGRFHGLLVRTADGSAALFNDRYGLHRLYCHDSPHGFYFAAEAKAILAVRSDLRALDPESLAEFITCGCVLENRCLFKDIHILPAGSVWKFQRGTPKSRGSYFRPCEWETQTPLDDGSAYDEIRSIFSRNLGRYFNSSERVAMSLTGGLDTRMIMAWHKPAPGSLPCYSFGGVFRDSHDVVVARQVARACGQRHETIRVGDDFLSRFPHYAERTVYLTDGCTDVSHSPDLYVNQQAATIAPVRMTGNYGGEIMRRVRAFKPVLPASDVFQPELLPFIRRVPETYASLVGGHPLTFAAFRQTPWHHYGLLALEQTQLSLRSPYLDNDFVQALFRAPAVLTEGNDLSLRLIADGDLRLSRIPTDRGVAGNGPPLLSALSRAILEFSFKAEYAYDYGMPQRLVQIDRLLSPLHLEKLFLGRHKFYHFRLWYRDRLAEYMQSVLLDARSLSRPYVQKKAVQALVNRHVKGTGNHTTEIHKLLTLELTCRQLVDEIKLPPISMPRLSRPELAV
jgi:asparagine synthase (glutamine-hydrolysing)